ncbi:MAG TPA: hypothetical protein VHB25_18125 [Gemmatimonadaceae bacterium]|nr:hypothetical protein [Gemmatimonadaceae bacterium]
MRHTALADAHVFAAALSLTILQAAAPAPPFAAREPLAPRDSARVLHAAESAQRGFERFRRDRLPVGDSFTGPCDVRVGRYCYWRGDDDDDEGTPPAEAPDVTRRRDALISVLSSASTALPGDAWLAGQRAYYLVDAGRADEAIRFATTECAAARDWCLALAGFAAHSAGRFALADSLYEQSLAAMTPPERCRWLDVRDLLDNALARRFESLDCAARDTLARRVLRLGAPLLSVSATDLLTEHLARLTRIHVAEHAELTDRAAWGDDVRELMLRYGWPRWYSRTTPAFGSQLEPSITGHDAGRPYYFLPRARLLDSLGSATDDDWSLDDRRAPAAYAPRYLRILHLVPHQFARFRRGDSVLVVGAWDARRDTTLIGRPLAAALVLANVDSVVAVARRSDARATGRLTVIAPLDSGLVSLELLAEKDRRAARARAGILPRADGLVSISDLLLYAPDSAEVRALADVADSALTSDEIARARPVGVYWELYGMADRSAPVRYTLNVEQIGVSWMRRTAERLHLADATSGLRIQWEEMPRASDGVAARGVHLDLSRLRPGTYRVRLRAESGTDAPVVATRDIRIH